ncbi:MAG: glycosyltransferase family 4 protein [Clostridia bacterium]|nr:glycosyltransferase family 4 protein [Clostridia bacterium]
MKVLFCYEGKMKIDAKGNIYPQALTEKVLNRYLFFGDSISIFCRKKNVEENPKSTSRLSDEMQKKIAIIKCPNFLSIKGLLYNNRKFTKTVIEKEVKDADFCIIRLPSFLGRKALEICNKNSIKYVVEMVGDPFDSYWNYGIKGKLIAPIMYIKTKKALLKAKNVQYVSNKYLQNRYPTKGYSIGCSDVELKEIDNNVLINRKNKIVNLDNKGKIIIGTLAAIDVNYKGQEYVIKAIAHLKKKGYNIFEYKLVGGGNPNRLLNIAKKYGVSDNIKIIGSLPHDKIFDWLDSIDIYIQPSNQEGLSRALVEAMSRGCPCIASNAGGNPELINEKYVFKKKDVHEIVNKILCITSTNENMLIECEKNFEKAKEFATDVLDKKRRDFYNKIIN